MNLEFSQPSCRTLVSGETVNKTPSIESRRSLKVLALQSIPKMSLGSHKINSASRIFQPYMTFRVKTNFKFRNFIAKYWGCVFGGSMFLKVSFWLGKNNPVNCS